MLFSKNNYNELKLLLVLALPLIGSGFAETAVSFFSTFFLAHLNTEALAAGALVSWLFFTMMVIMWGTLTAISTLVAKQYGAKNSHGCAQVLHDGLLLVAILTVPTMLILWNAAPFLLVVGQKSSTVALATPYLHALACGVGPDFFSLVLMQFIIGLGHSRVNLVFSLVWVPVSIISNYLLIFGKWGLPALGIAGIGWGITFSFWLTTTGLVVYLLLNKRYSLYLRELKSIKQIIYIKELIAIGSPMGCMFFLEIGFFLALALLMGRMGTEVLAANQIAMQFIWQTGVITRGIAQAVTVRVGHLLGAKNYTKIKHSAYCGMVLAVTFLFLVALIYWFFPEKLISLDLNVHIAQNSLIIKLAAGFLAIAGIMQILEALRFTTFGALRGLSDTRFTLFTSILNSWVIGLPLGYYLAYYLGFAGNGLWWGTVIGTAIEIPLVLWRFQYMVGRFSV
jgi:MATE family multidrug resistance protein